MADPADYELKIWPEGDTFSARIFCEAFVSNEDGFESVDDALAWAQARTAAAGDPFVYED